MGPDKSGYQVNIFLIFPQKHMLWVLIRSASLNNCLLEEIRKISFSYFSTKSYVVNTH